MDIKSLEKTAAEIRCGIIKAIHNAGSDIGRLSFGCRYRYSSLLR